MEKRWTGGAEEVEKRWRRGVEVEDRRCRRGGEEVGNVWSTGRREKKRWRTDGKEVKV